MAAMSCERHTAQLHINTHQVRHKYYRRMAAPVDVREMHCESLQTQLK